MTTDDVRFRVLRLFIFFFSFPFVSTSKFCDLIAFFPSRANRFIILFVLLFVVAVPWHLTRCCCGQRDGDQKAHNQHYSLCWRTKSIVTSQGRDACQWSASVRRACRRCDCPVIDVSHTHQPPHNQFSFFTTMRATATALRLLVTFIYHFTCIVARRSTLRDRITSAVIVLYSNIDMKRQSTYHIDFNFLNLKTKNDGPNQTEN